MWAVICVKIKVKKNVHFDESRSLSPKKINLPATNVLVVRLFKLIRLIIIIVGNERSADVFLIDARSGWLTDIRSYFPGQ